MSVYMKVIAVSSPVNIIFMARTVIVPQLHTPSQFFLFNFSFTLEDLPLLANTHKFLDSIAIPVSWHIKFVSAIEKLKHGNDGRCTIVFFNVTFIILLSCSRRLIISYLMLS